MASDYYIKIDEQVMEEIRHLPYLQASVYRNLNIEGTVDFFTRRYVQPLANAFDISTSTVVDCAAGFGWFSIAYLLGGGKAAVAVDINSRRLEAAKEIARLFCVADRMEFICSSIDNIPIETDEVDILVSIETLEHVGIKTARAALRGIRNMASKGVLITTPNKFFPVVAHDTRLPGIHWLPPSKRRTFAELFGREEMDRGNEFLSPLDLNILLDKFRPLSTCLTFQSYNEFRDHYPFYLPYGRNEAARFRRRPSATVSTYYKFASAIFGSYSFWVMPSLSHIFVRRHTS